MCIFSQKTGKDVGKSFPDKPHISLIFLSGGQGSRMRLKTPKQYMPVQGKPLARHSFETLLTLREVQEVVVVCEKQYEYLFPEATTFTSPGSSRHASVHKGYQKVSRKAEFVLVHDAARPFIKKKHVELLLREGLPIGAATLAVPLKYSLKRVNKDHFVEESVDRDRFFEIQTPQLLKKELLGRGLEEAGKQGITVTDDVSLAELLGHPVKIVVGSLENSKVTTSADLRMLQNTSNHGEVLADAQV